MLKLLGVCGVLAVATCSASAATPVRVALGPAGTVTVGTPWTATLSVRPSSFRGEVRVTAAGPGRISARATRVRSSYRVRLLFPASGRWTLTARAGGRTSPLGSVTVRRPAPLRFSWPTSVGVQPDGSLLVVENGRGRVVVVQPRTGAVRVLASGLEKPFAAVRAPSGSIYLSDGRSLKRLDGAGAPATVVTADADIGPIAVAESGAVLYASGTRLFRLPAGSLSPQPVTGGLDAPHGVAVTSDGTMLVSDTGNNRVLRIEPDGGAAALFRTEQPRGIDVAADGTIYVVEAGTKRVGHFGADGARLGIVGPVFGDPYDVAAGPGGAVFVVDTSASGIIRRVGPDGTVATIPTG